MLHTFTLKMKHMTLKQWNYLAMWDVIILEVRVEQWNPGQSWENDYFKEDFKITF